MYKFGQIESNSKDFNSVYQVIDDLDVEKITISEGITANKNDTRYIIGYEAEDNKVVPLYIKTPKRCISSGVSRYNEGAAWKMGFNVREEEAWINQYKAIWDKVEDLMFQKLSGTPLSNDAYINAKLIIWDEEVRTRFKGVNWHVNQPGDIGSCYATGILKIGSVYQQGLNHHLQVFLKECKYEQRDVSFKSQLSSSDDEGYDTVF
jgi:hypothetical protein